MAQLVAHLLCKQGVRGSSPLGSTNGIPLPLGHERNGPRSGGGLGEVLSPNDYLGHPEGTRTMTTNNDTLRFTYPQHLSQVQRDRVAAAMHTRWLALVEEYRRANVAEGVTR